MTKHTPGPWLPLGAAVIAEAEGIHVPAICHVNYGPANEANVRLISAAPDLLEALEAMTNEYHAVREGQGWHYELESITKARAALAKAEGEVNE